MMISPLATQALIRNSSNAAGNANTTTTMVTNALIGRDGSMINRVLYLGRQQQQQQQQQQQRHYHHYYRRRITIKQQQQSYPNTTIKNGSYYHYHNSRRMMTTRPMKSSSSLFRWSMLNPSRRPHWLIWMSLISSSSLLLAATRRNYNKTNCSAAAVVVTPSSVSDPKEVVSSSWQKLRKKARKALRMFARLIKLWVALTPLILLYPLLDNTESSSRTQRQERKYHWFTQWYLRFCLRNVVWSGAAVIKLMQWLSSRPDLVGDEFCAVFSSLQDSTTPHEWHHTAETMEEAYGPHWHERLQLDSIPIGSGCIGQVYKGRMDDKTVAVKVLHPNIEKDIETDLDWLRLAARAITHVSKPFSWLNPVGAVDEFGRMLTLQLDLKEEAHNLREFSKLFASESDYLIFPEVIASENDQDNFPPTKRVLVETYIEGTPILEYAKRHSNDFDLLHRLCKTGIKVVCKMIFVHNRCHGDLHPGNILITPDCKMALLDCGIVNTYSTDDHNLIIGILTSFIRHDGAEAGRLLLRHNNSKARAQQVLQRRNSLLLGIDEEGFVSKMNHIAQRAQSKEEHLMENLGTYISFICNAAATHHVLMNQSFVSAMLAFKVQEGIVLALDPALEIWKIANPIILEGEARRKARSLMNRMSSTNEESSFPWNLFQSPPTKTSSPRN